ncbi:hypothetical protein EDD18DRAFT_1155932 [Armillaria luteobubalina]|uniref:Uncharacterized protein n=1 Tax=Armillaria luteobubalina TaxID=153913 RepID=A0AA39QCX9_9AGAR|nr:hypothetical protein EDD18DRAFT_1155932 [Armillaria luteobubalina]
MDGGHSEEICVQHAASSALSFFQFAHMTVAFYGEMAWKALCPTSYRIRCARLDVHVEGDWTNLLCATQHLAKSDTAFKLRKILDGKHIVMSYYDGAFPDNNVPEAARQNCECQVYLNCGLVGKDYFFQVADIPLLLFQLLLLQRVRLYTSTASETKIETMMQEDLAATRAYIRLYPHRHEPCLLSPSQRLSVLRFVSWIRDSDSDAPNAFSRLSLGLSSTLIAPEKSIDESDEARNALKSSELRDVGSSIAESFSAQHMLIEIPAAVRLPQGVGKGNKHSLAQQLKKRDLQQTTFILSAIRSVSARLHKLGCSYYLSGPKDVAWLLLGSSTVPSTDIWFSVVLSDDTSLDDVFKKLGVTKRSDNSFDYTDSSQNSCKILVEQAQPPESMELHPLSTYRITKDGIPIYHPGHTLLSHLTQPRLQSAILANYGLPERTYDQIVPVLKDLANLGVNLRQLFLDGEKRDKLDDLVKAVCMVNLDLREVFRSLGFAIPIGPEEVVHAVAVQPEKKTKDDVVLDAAKKTVKVLQEAGYTCAVSGVVASYLWSNNKNMWLPEVTEIVIFSRDNIKTVHRLFLNNPLFHTVKLQVPGSTTQSPILHYRIRGRMRGARKKRTSCQVHLVMSQEQMSCGIKDGLPLVPLAKVLSDVLQHWYDYALAESEEASGYATYVQALLSVANEDDFSASTGTGWNSPSQRVRARLFCSMFSNCKDAWGRLGNDIV